MSAMRGDAVKTAGKVAAVTNTMTANHVKAKVFSVPDVAKILGVSERHGYDFCKSTDFFDVVRIGSSIRVKRESFEQWFGPVEQIERSVYTIKEIAKLLSISERHAGNYCAKASDFEVLRVGVCVRVKKKSFDEWFGAK